MTATQIKVAIVGVTGYAGMELLRLLHAHPYVQVVSVHQTTATQETLDQTFPHLQSLYKITPTPVDPVHIMQNADLVFFATSSGVTKTLDNQAVVGLSTGEEGVVPAREYSDARCAIYYATLSSH